MATLIAQEKIRVTFPEKVTAFLDRRAKLDHRSVSQTLTAVVAGAVEDEKEGANDPYFNTTTMARLRESINQLERGEGVEHELIEA